MSLSDDEMEKNTGSLASSKNRRNAPSERRQMILQQKQMDVVPSVSGEGPGARGNVRSIVAIREENRRLSTLVEELRIQMQQVATENQTLKDSLDKEIAAIHQGHRQEIEHYQQHLQEAIVERNQWHARYQEVEQQYQELQKRTQALEITQQEISEKASNEELPKMTVLLTNPATTVALPAHELIPETPDVSSVKAQESDRHLFEAIYLKREIKRLMYVLEQEKQKLYKEQYQLAKFLQEMRQQSEQRSQILESRLRAQWRIRATLVTLGVIVLLVTMQFVFLILFRIPLASMIASALIAPLVICVILIFILMSPFVLLRQIYLSAPHKEREQVKR